MSIPKQLLEAKICNENTCKIELKRILQEKDEKINQLTKDWNELEECVESRLMSIPDDMCDDEVEEAKRTAKIAVYQVILGIMQEIKEGNNVKD